MLQYFIWMIFYQYTPFVNMLFFNTLLSRGGRAAGLNAFDALDILDISAL